MIETTIKIPQHLIYFYNLIKNYESTFGKNSKSLGMNTNEILILLEIYNREGLNQIDITKRYLITEANISQTTKKLMEKDLIEKKMDPENNSKNLLYLTEKGQNQCDELLVLFRDWNNKIIKGIPMEDLILFGETLAMINENCLKMD
ncbi:MAG: winged helix-turn-helix transcriptional regulator [Methanobrevibacter sp.]|nr:winged helix-turn-helix transcriptional regulator [Methanobrevibacter sp.]MBO7209897.1 winged helix-turn-helix transcriptional regulator [Methanobrevibacter sp.]